MTTAQSAETLDAGGARSASLEEARAVVEDVARRSECSELAVAREAIALAQAAAAKRSPDDRSAHVGYYLIDDGRHDLERAIGCVERRAA